MNADTSPLWLAGALALLTCVYGWYVSRRKRREILPPPSPQCYRDTWL